MKDIKKQGLKYQIIEAAREVLLSEGYRNLSLRKVARKIDVSATSIYLHFESKDDLVHCLIEQAIKQLNSRLQSALPKIGNPIRKLEKLALC